jgi:hypothetical protein
MAIETTTNVVRMEGIMTAPVDQEIVLLNMSSNNYVSLDAIGRRIWELMEAPITVNEMCCQLSSEFEGDQEQICVDVLSFLTELEREGLVRVIA